ENGGTSQGWEWLRNDGSEFSFLNGGPIPETTTQAAGVRLEDGEDKILVYILDSGAATSLGLAHFYNGNPVIFQEEVAENARFVVGDFERTGQKWLAVYVPGSSGIVGYPTV